MLFTQLKYGNILNLIQFTQLGCRALHIKNITDRGQSDREDTFPKPLL